MPTRRLAAALLLAASILPGCVIGHQPGGPQASWDQYTYQSTQDYPTTINVLDSGTGEVVWSYDIPVGKQLTIGFLPNAQKNNPARPDLLRYVLEERGEEGLMGGGVGSGIPVPGPTSRRVDVVLRRNAAAVDKSPTPPAEPVAR